MAWEIITTVGTQTGPSRRGATLAGLRINMTIVTSRTVVRQIVTNICTCFTNTNAGSGEPRAKALTGRFRANTDWACQPRVTVVNSIRADGLYLMTEQWANGRGVYARRDNDINTLCISWHGLYRHWWLGPCTHVGKNAGVGWLEEDGRCPYDGSNWRAGGTDRLMVGALVTTNSCMDFETEYNGTLVADSRQNVQRTDTAIACQTLCQQTKTCMAFTWYNRNTNCTLLSKITDKRNNIKYTVSGLPSCKEKGEYKRIQGCLYTTFFSEGRLSVRPC